MNKASQEALFYLVHSTIIISSQEEVQKGMNKWIYDFDNERCFENLNLQPGKYIISFRNSRSKSMAHTILKEFKISSGQNININL